MGRELGKLPLCHTALWGDPTNSGPIFPLLGAMTVVPRAPTLPDEEIPCVFSHSPIRLSSKRDLISAILSSALRRMLGMEGRKECWVRHSAQASWQCGLLRPVYDESFRSWWVWWLTPVMSTLKSLQQLCYEFDAILAAMSSGLPGLECDPASNTKGETTEIAQ